MENTTHTIDSKRVFVVLSSEVLEVLGAGLQELRIYLINGVPELKNTDWYSHFPALRSLSLNGVNPVFENKPQIPGSEISFKISSIKKFHEPKEP